MAVDDFVLSNSLKEDASSKEICNFRCTANWEPFTPSETGHGLKYALASADRKGSILTYNARDLPRSWKSKPVAS
jgi:hypothetical protein